MATVTPPDSDAAGHDGRATDTNAKPGPGRPAGADSDDTRQRVIDAACRCFAQYGYGPSTNAVIADMAGVTAGAVYYHFGTKRQLFDAVCVYVYEKIFARTAQVVTGGESLPGMLRAWLTESMRINHDSPELAAFVAAAPVDARRHPELADSLAKELSRMTEIQVSRVQESQRGGMIPADRNPVEVANLISAIIDGFVRAAARADAVAMDEMTELFEALLLNPAERAYLDR